MTAEGCDPGRLLHDLLGGLDGPEAREVGRHLRSCPACREERSEWSDLLSSYRDATAVEADPDLVARIEARLRKERRRRRLARLLPLALGAAAAAALAILGIFPWAGGAPEVQADPLAGLRRIQEEDGSWAGAVGPTAVAALAFLGSGSSETSGPDWRRIAGALHFLKKEGEAGASEELLRCLAVLRSGTGSERGRVAALQALLDHAFSKARGIRDPVEASLLREVVAEGGRAGLRTAAGARVLASLGRGAVESPAAGIDWERICRHLEERVRSSALPPIRLAGSYLACARRMSTD
ncbi:MAG: zf-HC2 domain-containing protein [Planctomycetota bacterium]